MKVGIVGHEAAKFTPDTEQEARRIIRDLLSAVTDTTVVSGACHLGGIDIWAEEEADALGLPKLIFPPKNKTWDGGFKPRNIRIAQASDVVHCIVVEALPRSYTGMRFDFCYHCKTSAHVKSGGCWTAKYAERLGKRAQWHIVGNGER